MRKHFKKAIDATPLRAIFCLGVALSAPPASALDLSWRPQLRIGTRATDNVRWASQNQEAALGFDNGGGLELKAATAVWNSTLSPSFNFRRFAIGEDLNADEYGVRSKHQWSVTERIILGANLDYDRDSTLTTELTDVGFENQVANRDSVTAQPNVTFLLSDRTQLSGSYLFNDVSFDTDANGRLVDYSFEQFSATASHAWRSNIRLFMNGFVSEFETSQPNARTRTYGAVGGVEYLYRQDMGATFSIGYLKSDIQFETQFLAIDPGPPPQLVLASRTEEESTSGPIAGARFFKDFEHTRARFEYNRRVIPSIRGSQQLEDDLLLTAEHDLTREWRLGLRGGYNIRGSEFQSINALTNQGSTTQLNRNQVVAVGWLSFAFTNEMTLRTEYRLTRNAFDETLARDSVFNHSLFMTFVYNGEPQFLRGF